MSSKKRIYLDVCTLCRPFDDQKQMRIRLDTDAYYLILQAIKNGKYEMIISNTHFEEVCAIEDVQERQEILALLNKYGVRGTCDLAQARIRAEELYRQHFGVADAAHLAFAETTADVFISCDDKLLKKYHKPDMHLLVMNPVEFTMKEELT
jgi:predicted nucleic acid-binding protein